MDERFYNLQTTDSSHNDQLQMAIKSLNSGEKDIFIITEDGERIETQRSLLCVYSSNMASFIKDVPCCSSTSISLPVSSLALKNLLKVLVDGVARADDVEELSDVAEAAKILGINLKNIDFESGINNADLDQTYKKVKTEPGVREGKIKKKFKTKTKKVLKEEKIKIKQEPLTEIDEAENLLQEDTNASQVLEDVVSQLDDSVSQEVVDMISKIEQTGDSSDASMTTCNECGKVCKSTYNLSRHMMTHTGEKPEKSLEKPTCIHCGKMFNDNYKLNRHILIHTGEKPFACNQCGTSFQRKEKLKLHMERNHQMDFDNGQPQKQFPCDECTKSFTRGDKLKYHLKTQHTGEVNFTCDRCGQEFLEKRDLNKHSKSCGILKETKKENDSAKIMFNCNLCSEKFPESQMMVQHLKDHQREADQMQE